MATSPMGDTYKVTPHNVSLGGWSNDIPLPGRRGRTAATPSLALIPVVDGASEDGHLFVFLPKELLVLICTKLTPGSYYKLAATCKYLYTMLINCTGIKLECPIWVSISTSKCTYGIGKKSCSIPIEDTMKQLRRWPFTFYISNCAILDNEKGFWEIMGFIELILVRCGVTKVACLDYMVSIRGMEQMSHFAIFVQKYEVKEIRFATRDPNVPSSEVFENMLLLKVRKIQGPRYRRSLANFNVNILTECTISHLRLDSACMTKEGFEKVLQVWMSRDDLEWWEFGLGQDFSFMDALETYEFRLYTSSRPFSIVNPPILMRREGLTNEFHYMLRQDYKVLKIAITLRYESQAKEYWHLRNVSISMCPAEEVPLAFRGF